MKKERKTNQKEILIEYLNKHIGEHLTIQEIQIELKDKIGQTTIYRIINNLVEKGLITKIPFENKQGFCYQYDNREKECINHYHLICKNCNKLFHFECNKIKAVESEAKQKENFFIDDDRITFYGLCNKCKTGVK